MNENIKKMLSISDLKFNEDEIIDRQMIDFEEYNRVILPEDLKSYFRILGNRQSEYDDNLFRFFSLKDFKSINDQLRSFDGVPDYSNIVNTLEGYEKYFVFADYMFHLSSYAIELGPHYNEFNSICVISGDRYKVIAKSFSLFAEVFVNEPEKLHL